MKTLSEQDHYEILEARRDASRDEIERSYRLVLATYADDSLAGYSVFEEGDAGALRERIELAYRVLSHAETRREYDATLTGADIDPVIETVLEQQVPAEALESPILQEPPPPSPPPGEFEPLDDADSDGDFDGARLRRYRMRCGMELEDIAGMTKINTTYLRFLEEERFADLPSKVYVRGFVTAFAQTLGVDAKRVAASYMKRYDEVPPSRRKGRFFEGR
jgi:curved DNA-binding protein CbpA